MRPQAPIAVHHVETGCVDQRLHAVLTLALLLAGCNQLFEIRTTQLVDAPPDAVGCSGQPFTLPTVLPDPDPALEQQPSLAADGLELWFSASVSGTFRVHRAQRASTADAFGAATDAALLSGRPTTDAALTRDSLTMVFVSRDADSLVLETSRTSIDTAFAPQSIVMGLGSISGGVQTLDLSFDGLTIYFANLAGELWTASRGGLGMPFTDARMLLAGVIGPSVSPDGRELFHNNPADADADQRIYRRVRAAVTDDFDPTPTVILEDGVDADLAQDGASLIVSSFGRLTILQRECP